MQRGHLCIAATLFSPKGDFYHKNIFIIPTPCPISYLFLISCPSTCDAMLATCIPLFFPEESSVSTMGLISIIVRSILLHFIQTQHLFCTLEIKYLAEIWWQHWQSSDYVVCVDVNVQQASIEHDHQTGEYSDEVSQCTVELVVHYTLAWTTTPYHTSITCAQADF